MVESDKEKTGTASVRAVDRALDILSAFGADDRELTASDLLVRTKLSRPTLYRLLYTLEEKNFISSSGDPQRFRLGPAVGRLSWAWSSSFDITELATPVLREIGENTGETVALFMHHGALRVCVSEFASTNPLSFKRGVGYSEQVVIGASGRAILAWLNPSPDELITYCQSAGLDPTVLAQQLEDVRQTGYAISHDEIIKGAVAVAVPFFGNNGKVMGSIGVFGPAVRMTQKQIADITPKIIESVRKLTVSLGGTQ
ncbi:IclR family transcriptional regulator [Alcaligenes endophyticus]|uniref:IclR family transcriptional regulator n=1 Tax=Alcaligenes endophyticus TaxID=1929088 RepID=A0ABT8EMB9_9BURK|nr:IclR family transcriptional regulator [Alcaligenes endophyticus]MCX5591025.1 IclR family transcriptional regulator [Alcaligenes endophyticus]MDN4122398.1 IclR family transcriptional regulator [Alcaligenes endophyticus]